MPPPNARSSVQAALKRNRTHTHTRRVFDLVARTAEELRALLEANAGMGGVYPDSILLTCHAYEDFLSPPLFEKDPRRQPEAFYRWDGVTLQTPDAARRDETVLPPVVTPMLAGTRDDWEYSDEAGRQGVLDEGFKHLRVASDQFNLHRWSLIARQTGLYEYFWGHGFLVPRIYTTRLRNSIKRGWERARSRVFVAETLPNFGLDGIKYFEASRLLWNRDENPEVVRSYYCRGLFNENPADLQESPVAQAMHRYFGKLEAIWNARPQDEFRQQGGSFGHFQGFGIGGRTGWVTQLDYFMRPQQGRPGVVSPALAPENQMPFHEALQFLKTAFDASGPGSVIRERVQYFRRAFGLMWQLIRVYKPVLDVWRLVEPFIPIPDTEPLLWAKRVRASLRPDLKAELRRRLGTIATAAYFHRTIRAPVLQYLLRDDISLLDEANGVTHEALGLGLGQPRTQVPPALLHRRMMKPFLDWWSQFGNHIDRYDYFQQVQNPSTDPDFRMRQEAFARRIGSALTAVRSAPSIFMTLDNGQETDTLRSPPSEFIDPGFGQVAFWTMKHLVAAMMYAAQEQNPSPNFTNTNILLFMGNA